MLENKVNTKEREEETFTACHMKMKTYEKS